MDRPTSRKTWISFLMVILSFHGFTGRPRSCAEIQNAGSGLQICMIYPFGPEEKSVEVLCDFATDGRGWTIIQKRSSGPKEEFDRNWAEYENGFGPVDRNFWFGLKAIHALTKDLDQELRVNLWDFEGETAYAQYSNFSISNSSDFYRLSVDGYSGTANDSLSGPFSSNRMKFTTKDSDNDYWPSDNCAEKRRGAWWHYYCSWSHLNGLYFQEGETQDPKESGIYWYHWQGSYRALRQTEMKIRPRS